MAHHGSLLTCMLFTLLAPLALEGGLSEETSTCCSLTVPRREWGATASACSQKLNQPVRYVIVSHTAGSSCNSPASCQQQARNVQHYHMRERKWCDVAYNFLIGEDGLVYEGRGWNIKGDHTGYIWNPMSIGITFMGNYMERVPPARALRAAQNLLACGVAQGALIPQYEVKGHRDVQQTLSPGDQLYAIIQKWPHYRE
ncbi:PREDICTED: peptidoglycan recognition protein 1-like [Elephantulus edwardii]|uniref:peptidoglycan recognition protein 1-like n=1 Tax=Elephantulus edwardii TaxID=28737 RepID=UPI0003F0682C|nr:PREDICTED: peptidoglycan recognition protein 1-like [Elephantulus edwardii]